MPHAWIRAGVDQTTGPYFFGRRHAQCAADDLHHLQKHAAVQFPGDDLSRKSPQMTGLRDSRQREVAKPDFPMA
jgi:hypothetical protein